jgi:uncharacterized membrane protein (Fun14 family)
MNKIVLLVLVLVMITGLVWVSADGVKQIDDSTDNNVSEEQAEQIYSPIDEILGITVTILPWILVTVVAIGAIKFLQSVS